MTKYIYPPEPKNEPIFSYAPGSAERKKLKDALQEILNSRPMEIPVVIGGKEYFTKDKAKNVCPHDHKHVLANVSLADAALIKKAIEAEDRGFDAVMTVCIYDFGAEAMRHVVDIPVVGTGAATCHVASMMVDRVGVLAPTTPGVPITYKVLRKNGLYGDRVAPIRGVDLPVQELWEHKDELKRRIISLFQQTVDEGAQACWIVGTLLIPFAISAQEVQKELGVPVLDPIGIGVKMCELLAGVGYKNSRACYPFTFRPDPQDFL